MNLTMSSSLDGKANLIMSSSLDGKANLIIGQSLDVIVTITSSAGDLPQGTTGYINVNTDKNIIANISKVLLIPGSNPTTASAKIQLTVSDEAKPGNDITFNITTNFPNANKLDFTCKANNIDPQTLVLTVDNEFLDLPKTDTPPTGKPNCSQVLNKTYCTKVHTTVKDPNGNILSNLPVLISEILPDSLDKFLIYDSNTEKIITPTLINKHYQFYINSDKQGNIVFFLYSKMGLSASLNLVSMVNSVMLPPQTATTPVYALSSDIQMENYLWWPDILGFTSGNLISDGSENFLVSITKYDKAQRGDIIIFYLNGNERTNHVFTISDPDTQLDNYSIKLPYDMFESGKHYELSYLVILVGGSIEVSYRRSFTYMGGVIPKPDPDIKRTYDPCIVYTSLGLIPRIYIPENSYVNFDALRYYKYSQAPAGYKKTGLFIAIPISDTNTAQVPKHGVVKNVTVYIDTTSGGPDDMGKFQKSYPPKDQTIHTVTDGQTTYTYIIVQIPCEDIINYPPGNPGTISFDYEVLVDSATAFGEVWKGLIDTRTNAIAPCMEID